MLFYLSGYGPIVIGILLGVIVGVARRRSFEELPLPARISTIIGILIALACMVAYKSWGFFPPGWLPSDGEDAYLTLQILRFMLPLAVCVAALVVLLVPVRTPGPRGSADLAPRTLGSFAPRPAVVFASSVVILVIVATVIAGLASSRDDEGRFVSYGVDASTSSASTTIYGWWFSVPCLALIALIVAIALIELAAVSRPPLAADRARDLETRTTRARSILAVVTGGLLFHFGDILQSLYAASGVRIEFEAQPGGSVVLGTSFAAIGPTLLAVSYVSVGLGFALWSGVLATTVLARSRRDVESVRP
jgi:uncharacterized membrane protein